MISPYMAQTRYLVTALTKLILQLKSSASVLQCLV